ncbi:hypothetical protein DUNSADRAFT_16026, partial [Dunaliella salina]
MRACLLLSLACFLHTSISSAELSPETTAKADKARAASLPQGIVPGGQLMSVNDTCWAVQSVWPERKCVKKSNVCAVSGPSQAGACMFCARGYGVYRTEQDCLNAPFEGELQADVSSSVSIDPSTYSQPAVADSQCWPSPQPTTSQDPCPHLWPDVRLWEDAATWPDGRVPPAGSAVTLPQNSSVLISGCSVFTTFAIFLSCCLQLIFADAPLHLRVGRIQVNGRMRIGSPSCHAQQPITITFEMMQGLDKSDLGIQVSSTGQLNMHGREFNPTWTRLASTAVSGNRTIKLQEPVNWEAGQLVALATSIWRDEFENQNEVMTVESVDAGQQSITFTAGIQFHHYGGAEYQSEVALLSRSILLQGPPSAQNSKIGAHVLIHGQGRIEGVMAYRMGQRNVMGAHPFHFHMLGLIDSGSSYVAGSSVFNSFYRGVVLHGTSGVQIVSNVAFHVDGNCFYLEDGVEENNWLEHNFAGFIHPIGVPAGGYDQTGTVHVQALCHLYRYICANLAFASLSTPAAVLALGLVSNHENYTEAFRPCRIFGMFNNFGRDWIHFAVEKNKPNSHCLATQHAWIFVPMQRPLKRFEGNTAHSSGYFFLMAGGVYFGGKIWHNADDGGKLYYSSGRHASDPRTESGTQQSTHYLLNNKVWLAQWGVSHWGQRVMVDGWEAYDCVRGANIFGSAHLTNALIDGRSDNAWAQYPGSLADIAPIAGFQWYDNSVVHSDEFLPSHISTSIDIKYEFLDMKALVNNPKRPTGASRYFNWVDWDGSASLRMRPSIFGSYPEWWRVGEECSTIEPEWNVRVCDWAPWETPGRMDFSVPGYTIRVNSGSAASPTPENVAGYAAQFGLRGAQNRSVPFTRNEGTVGVTGVNGWYIHFRHGVTPLLEVYPNQIPPGTSIVFATRYPRGTTFAIHRYFRWKGQYSSALRQASSLEEVLENPSGELFWFSSKHLYIKMTDPDAKAAIPPLELDGAVVWGTRYFELKYVIEATNLPQCPLVQGGRWCAVEHCPALGTFFPVLQEDASTDIPDALPASYLSWLEPYCADVPPPGNYTCAGIKEQGSCDAAFVASPTEPHAQALGSYCGVTCGRCTEGEAFCVDRAVPGGLSGGKSCPELKAQGDCSQSWMFTGDFCALTCQRCGSPSCVDEPPDNQ